MQRNMTAACGRIPKNSRMQKCGSTDNILYVENRNIAYCFIQKISSTFWKRILQIAGGGLVGNITDPNAINPQSAQRQAGYIRLTKHSWRAVGNMFPDLSSFMFVRNPYTRLFSAWYDKMYSPNPLFWKQLGKRATENDENAQCYPKVGFGEMVDFVTDTLLDGRCLDGHFSTYTQHCRPCDLPYNYIATYEHIKDDTEFLVDKLNLTEVVKIDNFESGANDDAIVAAASWVFSQRTLIENCGVKFPCALYKVWHWLTGRGVISKLSLFPFDISEEIPKYITKTVFIELLKKAAENVGSYEKNQNRNEAFAQAMSLLTNNQFAKIRSAYSLDFHIFGYDTDPPKYANYRNMHFDYFPQC